MLTDGGSRSALYDANLCADTIGLSRRSTGKLQRAPRHFHRWQPVGRHRQYPARSLSNLRLTAMLEPSIATLPSDSMIDAVNDGSPSDAPKSSRLPPSPRKETATSCRQQHRYTMMEKTIGMIIAAAEAVGEGERTGMAEIAAVLYYEGCEGEHPDGSAGCWNVFPSHTTVGHGPEGSQPHRSDTTSRRAHREEQSQGRQRSQALATGGLRRREGTRILQGDNRSVSFGFHPTTTSATRDAAAHTTRTK